MKRFSVALGLAGMLAAGVAMSGPPAQGAPVVPPAASAPHQVLCGTPTWGQAAPYPVNTGSSAVVGLDNDLYSFGGMNGTGAYKYTAATDSWAAISSLPISPYTVSAATDGTAVYLYIGMGGPSRALYRYDPAGDSYTMLALPPTATTSEALVYLNGKIYRIGGQVDIGGASTTSVDVYTISTDTWAAGGTAADYPLAAASIQAVAYGGYIYAGGGTTTASFPGTAKTYRYDPVANSWDDAAVPDFRQNHLVGVSGVINGRWVVAGGYDSAYQVDENVETLDLTDPAAAWTGQPWMPQWRYFSGGAVAGSRLYVIGGFGNSLQQQADVQYFSDTPCTGGTPTATRTGTPTQIPPTPGCDITAWSRLGPYPVPAALGAVAAQGGLVYSFGGFANGVGSANAYKMNPAGPAGATWTAIAPLPFALQAASAVSDGTYLYILNGYHTAFNTYSVSSLYRYDPVTNTYTTLAVPPLPTAEQGAVYLDGKIYRIGGYNGAVGSGGADTATMDVYTISTDTWAPANTLAPYPVAMRPLAATTYNGYIYVLGGQDQAAGILLYRYDPQANSWSNASLPRLPDNRYYSASGLLNGKWIIMGGRITPQVPLNSGWSLDFANPSATWVAMPAMPVAVEGPAGVVVDNALFAVGGFTTGPGASQVVQRYQIGVPCNSVTPSATVTATGSPTVTASPSATATASPTDTTTPSPTHTTTPPVPTATATASATACAISFNDVQPSDYFYTPVQNLACRGVIGGYSDGTYRPYNNTTRGQMSKIVVGAFGLPLQTPPAGGYSFADVAPGSTFFAYIETIVAHGIVGGYACGHTNPQTGAAEPCDGASRPYYRPGNNVTRAQLTKMVVLTAVEEQGWTLRAPPTPTFSDVPPGDAFYGYIETAVCHGVLGGYSDGTFRPGNSALRGQIAKIVYNAGLNLACSAR